MQVCLPLLLIAVISVGIDSVWGCAHIFNMVRNLLASNENTPVIEFSPANEAPTVTVNFIVCIMYQSTSLISIMLSSKNIQIILSQRAR